LLEVLEANKKADEAAALAEEKRLAKNARAAELRAKKKTSLSTADDAAVIPDQPTVATAAGVNRSTSKHLLKQFDKASNSAEVKSSFTKQSEEVLAAAPAKVTSEDDGTSDGLSEIGDDTDVPAVDDYVQVKITSTSFAKGPVMQVHRVKDKQYTLKSIGAAVSGAKKASVHVKNLDDIMRSGVTTDIYQNAVNLQDYLNLRVANPMLPEAKAALPLLLPRPSVGCKDQPAPSLQHPRGSHVPQ
jgi:hypothetical protein